MPIKSHSNNRVLPANARAADVATKAIYEILPAQQMRTYNAFRVQGYQGLLYNRLQQGRKCTCQASQKQLNSRLDRDGKATVGAINQLLTGSATFDVSPYGSTPHRDSPFTNEVSPLAPVNPFQGVFDVVGTDLHDHPSTRISDEPTFGDNGPLDPMVDIEQLVGDFDAAHLGFTDVTCGVCFGTGFVGGYAPFHGQRIILTPADVNLGLSTIDYTAKPWSATTEQSFSVSLVLPLGALGLDSLKLWNGYRPCVANFSVDGTPIANDIQILKYCDGRVHTLEVTAPETKWTHLELQLALSVESPYFEFPKLTKGSDTSLLEQLEPFQIIMSPNVPSVRPEDVIVESTFGKTLIVQNSNWWNTRKQDVLGWECNVRVIQPQELYRILPARGRVQTKSRTTNAVHDNIIGNRT